MRGRSSLLFAMTLFLAAAVVSVMLFVHAGRLRQQARDTDRAVLAAQTVIEEFKAGGTPPQAVYFDRDFNVVPEPDESGFALTIETSQNGSRYEVSLAVERLKPYRHNGASEVLSLAASIDWEGGR